GIRRRSPSFTDGSVPSRTAFLISHTLTPSRAAVSRIEYARRPSARDSIPGPLSASCATLPRCAWGSLGVRAPRREAYHIGPCCAEMRADVTERCERGIAGSTERDGVVSLGVRAARAPARAQGALRGRCDEPCCARPCVESATG